MRTILAGAWDRTVNSKRIHTIHTQYKKPEPPVRLDQPDTNQASPNQASIVAGSSMKPLKTWRKRAPTAPSTTRWSQDRVQVMTVATPS